MGRRLLVGGVPLVGQRSEQSWPCGEKHEGGGGVEWRDGSIQPWVVRGLLLSGIGVMVLVLRRSVWVCGCCGACA